jgi:plasmid stability protein
MAQLIVRNIEETLVKLLKIRAARHGRSAEAEHREILREALQRAGDSASFEAFLLDMPDVGEDIDFERLRDKGRKVTL